MLRCHPGSSVRWSRRRRSGRPASTGAVRRSPPTRGRASGSGQAAQAVRSRGPCGRQTPAFARVSTMHGVPGVLCQLLPPRYQRSILAYGQRQHAWRRRGVSGALRSGGWRDIRLGRQPLRSGAGARRPHRGQDLREHARRRRQTLGPQVARPALAAIARPWSSEPASPTAATLWLVARLRLGGGGDDGDDDDEPLGAGHGSGRAI